MRAAEPAGRFQKSAAMSIPRPKKHPRSIHSLSFLWRFLVLIPWGLAAQTQKVASSFSVDAPEVPRGVRAEATGKAWTDEESGPLVGPREFARERSGVVWLGSERGAARFDPTAQHPWDRWQYFAGRRWLAHDDAVANIVIEESGPVRKIWIRTRLGVSCLEWRPMTLGAKAALFEARIEARHERHGMIGSSRLRRPGDLATSETRDDDNDGLWTAMYLGAEAYRFAVTQAPEARARAKRAVEALMRLEAITGVAGFPARSFVSSKYPKPATGEWHATPDGQWWWKGDTSSDEIVGHYFGYALYYDLVATESERPAVRRVVARITDHLIQHDYNLVDLDGQPTRWGEWSERYFQTEEGKYEAPLRALELLAFLKTAHHITGDAKYAEAYAERVARGYATRLRDYRRWPGGGEINFSDDELAYLSYDPLLRYERDATLLAIYNESLAFTWGQIRPDRNPLWNYISAARGAVTMTSEILQESARTLERIPLDLIDWTVVNSLRRDVKMQATLDRFEGPQLRAVLAPDERPLAKWNANPYRPDGGSGGGSEDDGAFFLLPYWLGRFHGWLQE